MFVLIKCIKKKKKKKKICLLAQWACIKRNSLGKKLKGDYHLNKIQENSGNILPKGVKTKIIDSVKVIDKVITDKKVVTTILSVYFSNVGGICQL